MDRRPSDRTLRRWLAIGRPRRIGRLLESRPDLARRLDELSALPPEHVTAIHHLVEVSDEFGDRAIAGVQRRRDEYTSASLLFDLMGLGFHVGRAVLEPGDGGEPHDDAR